MISLCIKTNKNNVITYLMNNISKIDLDNIVFIHKHFSKYHNIIVHYLGDNTSVFYNELSSVLTKCVIDNYEYLIIHNLLLLDYFYFDNEDIIAIEDNCDFILNNSNSSSVLLDKDIDSSISNEINNRINYLWCSILKYITYNKSIFLDGFITFRTSDYINCLNNILDFSVNKFIINREYSEFINLLKMYIDSQTPKTDLIHLVYVNEESILLDKDKNIISLTKNNLSVNYLSDITFSSNDYALNSLLSLLPQKIIIHLISPSDDFINTLKLIFRDIITICTDCNICQTYRLINTKFSQ